MNKLDELKLRGCCKLASVLNKSLTDYCKEVASKALSKVSTEHREVNKSQGSLIHVGDYPEFSKLIGSEDLLNSLDQNFDFSDLRFSSGYLISKPPKSPPLFWHQDWWGWDHQSSYTDFIHQIFVMIYLTNTEENNGCLKFLPGSHRQAHRFHESKNAHSEELSRVKNPNDPLFSKEEDEENIPVNVGDIVIGDARVLHAANSNQSNEDRTLITLWYHPHYSKMTDNMRARIYYLYARKGEDVETDIGGLAPNQWQNENFELIKSLAPNVENSEPTPWQRKPNW